MEKELIGYVGVDAGCVWIGDPCYVLGEDASFAPKDWSEYCDTLSKLGHWDSGKGFCEPLGDQIGLHVQTLYGDGAYPVYAEYAEGFFGHKGIKSITIDFDPSDEEDDDFDYDYDELDDEEV